MTEFDFEDRVYTREEMAELQECLDLAISTNMRLQEQIATMPDRETLATAVTTFTRLEEHFQSVPKRISDTLEAHQSLCMDAPADRLKLYRALVKTLDCSVKVRPGELIKKVRP